MEMVATIVDVPAITYTDLWLITFIPIIIQAMAAFYVITIRHILGRRLTTVFGVLNGLALWYDATVTYLIFNPPPNGDTPQPVEPYGLFLAFIVPTGVAISLFILQKTLKDALIPIGGLKDK